MIGGDPSPFGGWSTTYDSYRANMNSVSETYESFDFFRSLPGPVRPSSVGVRTLPCRTPIPSEVPHQGRTCRWSVDRFWEDRLRSERRDYVL